MSDGSDLIGAVYSAALSPCEWQPLLALIAAGFHATVAFFGMSDARHRRHIIPVQVFGLSLAQQALFFSRFVFDRNPYAREMYRRSCGEVMRTEEVVPWEILQRTELYQELMVKTRSDYGAGVNLSNQGAILGALSLYRERAAGPFDEEELSRLQRLAPHLVRAAEVMKRLGREEQGALACHALDRLPAAVFLTGPTGKLVFANTAACALLRSDGPLVCEKGLLQAREPGDTGRIQRAIRQATLQSTSVAPDDGGVFSIAGPGASRLSVVVVPLARRHEKDEWPAGGGAMVVVEAASPPDGPELLQRRFGLTPAEARVALQIAEGRTLREAAETSQVSINTVRTQLQRIFDKTETRRQAQLVRLVATEARSALRQWPTR
jgi:DNA-binding CsgD family transcriptional regulator